MKTDSCEEIVELWMIFHLRFLYIDVYCGLNNKNMNFKRAGKDQQHLELQETTSSLRGLQSTIHGDSVRWNHSALPRNACISVSSACTSGAQGLTSAQGSN